MPHYFALQALAIRENTVYIHGTPSFPKSETQIYLDIEGLPDNESYYLIGALVVSEGERIFSLVLGRRQIRRTGQILRVCEISLPAV
jgi:predicted RecB family nuclease